MSTRLIIDIVGWVGAAALIIAYALVSTKRLSGHPWPFQLLNRFGGLLLIINTLFYKACPSSFLNLVWTGMAIATIIRLREKNQNTSEEPPSN